jgi:hypothetical protein
MTSPKSVLCLLLLVGLATAFNVQDYLYPEEENATVSYENFTLNGTDYSIVRIAGQEAFLLEEGEPVTEKSDVQEAVYSYYLKMFYPSEEEIEDLKDLVERFNDSRNDGYDWRNKEEYICRDEILLSNGKVKYLGEPIICRDEESCERIGMLLYSAYGQGLGIGSPTPLIEGVTEFTPYSLEMDDILNNYSDMLENLDEDTLEDTIDYIEDTVDTLRTNSDKIETTIFRTPRLNDSDDRDACYLKCYAICPSFDLDQDALDDIEDSVDDLSSGLGPISDYQGISNKIYSNSAARLNYTESEMKAEHYTDIFSPLNETGEEIIEMADEADQHVSNSTLSSKLFSLKSLHMTIPEDIEDRNFTTMEDDILSYEQLLEEVNESASFLLVQYNKTRDAKNQANSLLFVLESKDLDPVSIKSRDILRNRTADLDAEFRDGLTINQLVELEGNYTELAEETQELLMSESDIPATRVLLLFRGYARKVNTGIASVAENTDVIPLKDIPGNSLTLPLFSALVFLSLASIVVLAFLYIVATTRFDIPKSGYIVGAAFAVLLAALLAFSFFMYLFLGKTSTDATLTEFLSDFNSKNETAIVVDLRNTSYSDSLAMGSCASDLAGTFGEKGKSWTMYTVTSNTCTKSDSLGSNTTLSVDDCLERAENETSLFRLEYSASNEPPRFSVIYENKAEIRANLDYYDSCPLVALFN